MDHPAPGWGIIGPVAGRQNPFVCFGPFEANLATRQLHKNGVRLKLQDQPFRLLEALLEKPGEVVTREELQQRIWGEDTYVDFDKSLSAAVNKVRQALGDSRTRPCYIETIPKVGYRFIGSLHDDSAVRPTATGESKHGPRWQWVAALGALATIALVGWHYRPRADPVVVRPLRVVPLTSYEGREEFPTFSPDGSQVAFIWQGPGDANPALYVKTVSSEPPRRLTDHAAEVNYPAWSPDGASIAYLLKKESGCELRLIPPAGGASRPVTDLESPMGDLSYSHLAWSPDGRWIAYPDKPRPEAPVALFAVEPATGEIHQLTNPPKGTFGDDGPAFSQGGEQLAFVRRMSALSSSYPYILDLSEVSPGQSAADSARKVTQRRANSVAWVNEDHELVLAGEGLWRIASDGDKETQVLASGEWVKNVTLSRTGNRLAFVQYRLDTDIWQLDRSTGQTKALITSTHLDWFHSISPDGKRIAWSSVRSGSSEIWVCNADGSHPLKLTSFHTQSGAPAWSPDGKLIAFDTRVSGNGDIYVIDAEGGVPRPLIDGPDDDLLPTWSPDGKTLYFVSHRGGEYDVWAQNLTSGEVRLVSSGQASPQTAIGVPSLRPKPSPDGKSVFFTRAGRLHRKALPDGDETVVLDGVKDFIPTRHRVYFTSADSHTIGYLDLTSGKVEELLTTERDTFNIAVFPDEQVILFTQTEPPQSDVMLVEGFE